MKSEQRLIYKEVCETCHGMGMVGELTHEAHFVTGMQCPDCGGKGYRLINNMGVCPKCHRGMVHYRLHGYVCPYCEKDS